jgi:hypothetical protein
MFFVFILAGFGNKSAKKSGIFWNPRKNLIPKRKPELWWGSIAQHYLCWAVSVKNEQVELPESFRNFGGSFIFGMESNGSEGKTPSRTR